MKRGLCITCLLFLCAGPAANYGWSAPHPRSSDDNYAQVELQGCLEKHEGYLVLIDKNNMFDRLSESSKLRKLVGHEVKVTGKRAVRTVDTTLPGAASSAVEVHYVDVKTVTDVAPNCVAYGR